MTAEWEINERRRAWRAATVDRSVGDERRLAARDRWAMGDARRGMIFLRLAGL
jgi:hypothetical protein